MTLIISWVNEIMIYFDKCCRQVVFVVVVVVAVVLKSSQSICFSRSSEEVKWYMKAIYFFYKPRTGV